MKYCFKRISSRVRCSKEPYGRLTIAWNYVVTAVISVMMAGVGQVAVAANFTFDGTLDTESCVTGWVDYVSWDSDGSTSTAEESADACWGAFDGNDSNQTNGEVDVDVNNDTVVDATFTEISKVEIEGNSFNVEFGAMEMTTDGGGASESGTWDLNSHLQAPDDSSFLLVLKSGNQFAVWLFAGDTSATNFSGQWQVPWGKDLSHLTAFVGALTPEEGPPGVPVPGTFALVILGMLLLRCRRSSGARA
ncbi:MAG: MYXO-CTERM domain-containing protein [Halieaceae bacterium]|jgi:MYXO-CTERM domain-containing protein